jgi:hypothetical protein
MSKKYRAFSDALEKVLSVTHAEIKQLEADEKKKRTFTGKKRGRKPKPPASSGRA